MTSEVVPFRLIVCPACSHMLCWINPRLPNHCPECGTHIALKVKESVRIHDPHATLKHKDILV